MFLGWRTLNLADFIRWRGLRSMGVLILVANCGGSNPSSAEPTDTMLAAMVVAANVADIMGSFAGVFLW